MNSSEVNGLIIKRFLCSCLKIQEERDRRHRQADMLEAHIMQAQAAAMAADERELQRMSEGYENYHVLGLPPGTIIFCFCALLCKSPVKSVANPDLQIRAGGGWGDSGHPDPTILKIKVFLKS